MLIYIKLNREKIAHLDVVNAVEYVENVELNMADNNFYCAIFYYRCSVVQYIDVSVVQYIVFNV